MVDSVASVRRLKVIVVGNPKSERQLSTFLTRLLRCSKLITPMTSYERTTAQAAMLARLEFLSG